MNIIINTADPKLISILRMGGIAANLKNSKYPNTAITSTKLLRNLEND